MQWMVSGAPGLMWELAANHVKVGSKDRRGTATNQLHLVVEDHALGTVSYSLTVTPNVVQV